MKLAIAAVILLGILGSAAHYWWEWLTATPGGIQTRLAIIRDLALVGFGISGFLMVIWRNSVADKQMVTSRQGLLNERFKIAVDLLSGTDMSGRVGGAYLLNRIADEQPDEFHREVMTIFLAFLSRPPQLDDRPEVGPPMWVEQHGDEDIDLTTKLRSDVAAVLTAIGRRSKRRLQLDANRSDLLVERANLAAANLSNLNLSDIQFFACDLSLALFAGSNLDRTSFHYCILSDASFHERGKRPATGLSQTQMRMAVAENAMQPEFNGVTDCETGKPLRWEGITAP